MPLNTEVRAALDALVGGRVYPHLAPQNAILPRITYQEITVDPVNSLAGSSGLDAVRVQVDVWADSALEAATLAETVRTAMAAAAFKGLMESRFGEYEQETKTYRVSQDFRCWHRL